MPFDNSRGFELEDKSAAVRLKLSALSSSLAKDLDKILKVGEEYAAHKQMPNELYTSIKLMDVQHATFYIYCKFIIDSILEKNPLGLIYFAEFLDNYLDIHFSGEIKFIKQVAPWDYKRHKSKHDELIAFWKSSIIDPVRNLAPSLFIHFRNKGSIMKLDKVQLKEKEAVSELLNAKLDIEAFLRLVSRFYKAITSHIEKDDLFTYGPKTETERLRRSTTLHSMTDTSNPKVPPIIFPTHPFG